MAVDVRSRLGGTTVSVAGGMLLSNGSLAVVAIRTARELGPGTRGVLVVILSVSSLTMVLAGLGANFSGRLLIPRDESQVSLASYLRLATVLCLAQTIICGLATTIVLGSVETGPRSIGPALAGLYGGSVLAALLTRDALYAVGRSRPAGLLEGLGSLLQLALVILVLRTQPDSLGWLVGAMAVAMTSQSVAALAVLRGAGHHLSRGARWDDCKTLIVIGVPTVVFAFTQAAVLRIDRVLLGTIRAASEVGIYSVAATATEWLWLLPVAFAQTLFHPVASGTSDLLSLRRSRRIITSITVALAGLLAVLAPWLINFVFGEAYLAATTPLRIQIVGAVALGSFYVDVHFLLARSRRWQAARLSSVGLVAIIILDLALIPPLGAVGAAWASTVVYCTLAVLSRREATRAAAA